MSLFIGLHGIYSEVFLRRRLLTDFRGGDLFGRCRYPLGLDKAIHQRFHKKSVEICEICGTKEQREGEPRQLFLLGSQTNIEIAQLSRRHA